MDQTITIQFQYLLEELEKYQVSIGLVRNQWIALIDEDNNLYQIETYYVGSYLERLVQSEAIATFHLVEPEVAERLTAFDIEIWDEEDIISVLRYLRKAR